MPLRVNTIKLVDLANKIRGNLGYCEYQVQLPNGNILDPRPFVKEKTVQQFRDSVLQKFVTALNGGNPIFYLQVEFARNLDEETVRQTGKWIFTKDSGPVNYVCECLPVDFRLTPQAFQVTLAVMKEISL
jgi:hypothetical protein